MKKFLKLGTVLAALGLDLAMFASCSNTSDSGDSSTSGASENGSGGNANGGNTSSSGVSSGGTTAGLSKEASAILELANKFGNRWEGSGKYKFGSNAEENTLQLAIYSLDDFKKQSDLYSGRVKEDLDEAEEKNTKKGEVVFFLNTKDDKYGDGDIWLFPIDGTWYYEPEKIETVKSSLSQNGKQFTLVTEWNEKDGEYESNGKETVVLDISDDGSVKFKWTEAGEEEPEVVVWTGTLSNKSFVISKTETN